MASTFANPGCFACGPDNPRGLRLELREDGAGVSARFVPDEHLRGFSRVVHGGVHAALLDEAIGVAVGHALQARPATVSLTVDYLRPMFVGQAVTVRARFVRRRGRFAYGAAEIVDEAGQVLARARGRVLPLDDRLAQQFVGRSVAAAPSRGG